MSSGKMHVDAVNNNVALVVRLIALPYYQHSSPVLAGIARRALALFQDCSATVDVGRARTAIGVLESGGKDWVGRRSPLPLEVVFP